MPSLENQLVEDQEQEGRLTDEDEMDLEIAVLLGKRLLDDGGKEVILSASKSQDPGQVIGQFLLQLGSQLDEQMPEDSKLSPAIFLAKGGWLEQMSDFIQEEYDVPKKDMDRAEIYVASTAQQMAQKQQGQAQPGQPATAPQPAMPAGGPAMPQGGQY